MSRTAKQPVSRRRLWHGVVAAVFAVAAIGWWVDIHRKESCHIVLFDGYGTPDRVLLTGRVLEDDPANTGSAETAWWRNMFDVWQLLDSEELPNVRLRIEVGGSPYQAVTGEEGSFSLRASDFGTRLAPGVHQVRATVVGPAAWAGPRAVGTVHVLPPGPCVAVISDFDDTVAKSHVTDRVRLVREAAFKNAAQIDAVEGVEEAYRRASRAGAAAFFYVSGSPINFFPRIVAFLELHDLPRGPMLLKDFGRDPIFAQEQYKLERIEGLLETFPHMRVVLVGDSGERDPEVYRGVRDQHPQRVAGIVIRLVPGDTSDIARFEGMTTLHGYDDDTDAVARFVRAGRDAAPSGSIQ